MFPADVILQTMLLLAMVEMGRGEHQKAFLSVGQASRIVSMLGLTRLDEDRIHQLENGGETGRRLRPPALHHLPDDPVSLEECRRTVYVPSLPLPCASLMSDIDAPSLSLIASNQAV
jgi:hypothetical protein